MTDTNIRRRTLLAALAASAGALSLPFRAAATTAEQALNDQLISAGSKNANTYALANLGDQIEVSVRTGFRGHEVIAHPSAPNHYIYFARRPGTRGLVVDIARGRIAGEFYARAERHFYGHGYADPVTNRLYTTEADLQTGEGKIGVRDLATLEQVDELPSHGVGPHQLHGLPDRKTLVVANGGLATRPDSGRKVLNPATMCSRLTYLDHRTGEMLGEFSVAEPKASLRHLAVADDGTVAVGAQVQREACGHQNRVPLLAIQKPGAPLCEVATPAPLLEQLSDYAGSVAINNATRVVGITSPRGSLAAFWSLDTGAFLNYHAFYDVCGLATSTDERYFIMTNSAGEVRCIRAEDLREQKDLRRHYADVAFDNHLLISPRHLWKQ